MLSLDPVIEKIFNEALEAGASDIHFEPQAKAVRLRIHGQMCDGPRLEGPLRENLIAKLKLMARLDATQNLSPQDGAFVLQNVHARLSAIPALGGQSVVIRLFKDADTLEKLSGLGLEADQVVQLENVLQKLQGLVIIAGPTGSGKTTSFYAALRALDPRAHKIITVEDPIEQRLAGVCQVSVKGELTFAAALRSILRQSPNVIGVGELRDSESAKMALQAALTGHLVIATLHADSAAAVPVRLTDMGLEPAVLAEVLQAVVAQRLVFYKTPAAENACRGIFEMLQPTREIRQKIRARASAPELQKFLFENNFVTLRERAQRLVATGELTPESILGEFAEEK